MRFSSKSLSKRAGEMKQVSYNLRGQFVIEDEYGLRKQLLDFKLFRIGTRRKIENVITLRDEEKELKIFDYHYIISTGNSYRRYKQSVFFLNSKKLGLPEFMTKPENIFHRIGTWLGIDDIDFEEFPEFSKQYFLKGENESFIRKTFDKDLLKLFSIEKKWWVEGLGYYLVMYKKSKILKPQDIMEINNKIQFVYEKLRNENDIFYKEKEE